MYTGVSSAEEAVGCRRLHLWPLQSWFVYTYRLQFNAAKTELIWFGYRAVLRQ